MDLEQLKTKYQAVFQAVGQLGVQLTHVHLQDGKLFIQGAAPSEDIKNKIWDAIKSVDPSFADLTCDLSVDSSLPQPTAPAAAPATQTYTVVAGDSLWKISAKFLGNGANFHKIIEANPDKLKDEHSVIHPGDVLNIPAAA